MALGSEATPPPGARIRAHRHIGLARTDVMLGEADGAADAARQALAVIDDASSGRARRRLRDFYRESESLDTSSIRAVREAIADRLSSSYLRREGEVEAA